MKTLNPGAVLVSLQIGAVLQTSPECLLPTVPSPIMISWRRSCALSKGRALTEGCKTALALIISKRRAPQTIASPDGTSCVLTSQDAISLLGKGPQAQCSWFSAFSVQRAHHKGCLQCLPSLRAVAHLSSPRLLSVVGALQEVDYKVLGGRSLRFCHLCHHQCVSVLRRQQI